MSRTKNSVRMIIASTVCQIVILVCGLILPPLFIKHFGSEVNGFVNLVKQLMSYFGVVCLGLGVSAQVALYKPLSEQDWKQINKILVTAKCFFERSSIYFLILVLLSSVLFPYVLETQIKWYDISSIIIITGIGSVCEYVVITKYKVFLAAAQRQYINSKVTAEGILLNTIVSIFLIYLDCNIIIIQIASTAIYILRLLVTVRYVKRHFPRLSFDQEKPDYNVLKDRWKAFFYQLSGIIINLSPIIIVSFVGNLKDASVFSIYFMIFSSLAMIANIFSSGLSAPFGDIIVSGDTQKLKESFAVFEFMYTTVLTCCFFIICIIICSFVGSYIHNEDGVEYVIPPFAYLMSVYFFIKNFRIPFTTLVEAKGLFDINSKYNMIEAIIFVIFSIVLVWMWGIIGIAIAGIISSLPRTLLYIYFCKKKFNGAFNSLILVIKFTVILIIGTMGFLCLSPQIKDTIFSWIISIIPYILFGIFVSFVVNIILDFGNSKIFISKFIKLLH